MQKKWFNDEGLYRALFKCLRVMKLTVLILLATLMHLSASVYAQQTKLSISLKDATVRDVLKTVENQSEFFFLYKNENIDVNRTVNVDVKEKSVEYILDQIFKGTSISYEVVNRQIVLIDKEHEISLPQGPQQQKSVKGNVTDSSGGSLPGVSIVVKGTTTGVITDNDGNYSLSNIPENAILQFSFVGMKTQEVTLGAKTIINVTLTEESIGLEEVVAVGYGTQKKVNLTGAVVSVKFTELADSRPITSLSSGLAGLGSGLYVKQSTGIPGGDNASILIRGQGTLNNSSPLVIVDGVSGNMNDVNPNDVESISVLKDASSAAIYGSRAANGVILITTKRGNKGKVKVSYNGYYGVSQATGDFSLISDYPTHMELMNEAYKNVGQASPFTQATIDEWREKSKTDPILYPNTDWFNYMIKPAPIQEHNINFSGGSENSQLYFTLGYLSNEGIVEGSDYERYSFRIVADTKVNNWMSAGASMFGYWSIRDMRQGSGLTSLGNTVPGILPIHPDGRFGGATALGETTATNNMLSQIRYRTNDQEKQKFAGTAFVKFNIIKGLNFESKISLDHTNTLTDNFEGIGAVWNFQTNSIVREHWNKLNTLGNNHNRYYSIVCDELLTYNRVWGNHDITALVGFNQEYSRTDLFSASKKNPLDVVIKELDGYTYDPLVGGSANDRAIRSYFSRINYNYKNKYLFEANVRYDGSSRFSEEERWGMFPSFSTGWRLSEEDFLKNIDAFENLKLRASWGQLGNNNIGDYEYQSLYAANNYSFGNALVLGAAINSIANPIITWEKTNITDIGLDFSVIQGKLSGSIDWFHKLTEDILIALPIPYANGGVTAPMQNAGVVKNVGGEITLNYSDKIGSDFKYGLSGNFSYTENEVVKYKGDVASYMDQRILKEGLSILPYYVREVDHVAKDQAEIDALIADGYTFSPSVPKPGDFIYKDANGDKKINDDDRVYKGNSVPKINFGLGITMEYKGFDFYTLLQGVGAYNYYMNDEYYWSSNIRNGLSISKKFLNRWTSQNTVTNVPRLTTGYAANTVANDFYLQDASYMRIKNIQIGYSFPKSTMERFKMEKVRIYASAENYFTFTKFEGIDPEAPGVAYPPLKQIIFGLNVTF